MLNLFKEHPRQVGETYFQHCRFALIFGFNMATGGIACIIHAFFPFLFKTTGSHFLLKMMHFYIQRSPVVEQRVLDVCQSVETKKESVLQG